MKEQVNIIDFIRLFMALCVVAIHLDIMSQFPPLVDWYVTHLVFRLAVPFFFVVSGYFLGKKLFEVSSDKERMHVCKNFLKKQLPPFLFWGFGGLVWYTITLIRSLSSNIAWEIIQSILFYPRAAMWYVLASMLAVLVIGSFWRHKKFLAVLAGEGIALPLCLIVIILL